jgi:hypothetical protein
MLEQTDVYQLELAGIDDKIKRRKNLKVASRLFVKRRERGKQSADKWTAWIRISSTSENAILKSQGNFETRRRATVARMRLPTLEAEHVQLQSLIARHEMTRQNLT